MTQFTASRKQVEGKAHMELPGGHGRDFVEGSRKQAENKHGTVLNMTELTLFLQKARHCLLRHGTVNR